MIIKFLGTSAAERIPAMFCECEVCENSRKAGGKNIRTRSQALVDDKILIDFPADTFMHFNSHNVPFKNIKTCLITHSHMDHLYENDTTVRKRRFSYVYENPDPLVFYAGKSGYEKIEEVREKNGIPKEDYYAEYIEPFKTFEVYGYNVTAVNAVHAPDTSPYLYLIEKDNKLFFYSTDTGEYSDDTWNYLKNNIDKTIDAIALDCTYGNSKTTFNGHMDLHRCYNLKEKLIESGVADENTKFILTHFSHNGDNVMYDEFVNIAKEKGFITAYDGMIVKL